MKGKQNDRCVLAVCGLLLLGWLAVVVDAGVPSVTYLGGGVVGLNDLRGQGETNILQIGDAETVNPVSGNLLFFNGATTVSVWSVGGSTSTVVVPEYPISGPVWLGMRSFLRPGLGLVLIWGLMRLVRRGARAGSVRVD